MAMDKDAAIQLLVENACDMADCLGTRRNEYTEKLAEAINVAAGKEVVRVVNCGRDGGPPDAGDYSYIERVP